MRGYLSFVIVLLSSVLLLSLISLLSQARATDLSKAVALERAYGLEMNAKECALESVRHGAIIGFSVYDAAHDLENCSHCEDHHCTPPTPLNPLPPNICDAVLCSKCFRESEARSAALDGAYAELAFLAAHNFDPDFNVSYESSNPAVLEAFLAPAASSRNGVRLSSVRFREVLPVSVRSDKFDVSLLGKLHEGMVVRYGPGND